MSVNQRRIRYTERKYMLNEEQYRMFIAQIYKRLQYDNYRKYRMYSAFFCAPRFDLVRTLLQAETRRDKRTGLPAECTNAEAEPKRFLPAAENRVPAAEGQRSGQVFYLAYDRLVMKGRQEDLSLVFDTNFFWSAGTVPPGEQLGRIGAVSDRYVLKIRSSGQMPSWLFDALGALQLRPRFLPAYGG